MSTVIGDLFVRLGVDATNMTRGLETAEKRLESLGTRFFFLGSRVTAGVTLPILGAVGAVSKFGLDFDKAMTESLAIMRGITPRIRSEMEEVAKGLVATTKFSATEAAQGYYSLASAGLDAATAMGALPIAARFAQAGVMKLDQATHYLAASQAAMADGSETASQKVAQMASVSDVLTEANNRALGSIRDFADALTNRAGVALRITNKGIEEGTAILAAYAERGILGKAAGTQLWMMLRDLQHAALDNGDAFKKYGISIFDSTGKMRNMADILGTLERATLNMTDAEKTLMMAQLGMPQRSRAATIAIMGQSEAIRKHEAALRAAAGATQEVSDNQMKALSNQLLRLWHEFQVVGIEIFQQFVPTITDHLIPAARGAIGVLRDAAQWFGALPGPIKAVALGVVALAAAIGPIVAFFGSMTLLTSAAVGGLKAFSSAIANVSLNVGLAVGASGRYAFVTAAMTTAQRTAAIAAYTQARALGQSWAQAVGAGRAAAAATPAVGGLAAALGLSAGQASLFSRFMGSLPAMLAGSVLGLTTLVGWAGRLVAGFLKVQAVISVLGPSIMQLFTGWRTESDKAQENASGLGAVLGVAGKAWGVFSDATWIAGEGLKALVKIVQSQMIEDMHKMKRTIDENKDSWYSFARGVAEFIPGGTIAFNVLEKDLNTALERMPGLIRSVVEWWDKLKISTEFMAEGGGGDPEAVVKRQLDAIAKRLKRPLPDMSVSPTPGKPETWMSADDPLGFFAKTNKDFDAGPDKPKRETLSEKEREIRRYVDALKGQGQELDRLKAAWLRLSPAERGSAENQNLLWAVYSKMRGELKQLDPALEALFAKQIEQLTITGQLANGTNDWSITMSDASAKLVDNIGQITVAMLGMSEGQLSQFFKQHKSAIEDLLPVYGEQETAVQVMIDKYFAWAAAQSLLDSKIPAGAQKAKEAMLELLGDTSAKLADVQADIHQFSETAGETHRRTTRTKLNQIRNDQEKHLNEMIRNMAMFSGDNLAIHVAMIAAQRAMNETYLKAVQRYEDLRYAQTIGVNARILRSHEKLTDDELRQIIRRQEAWNRYFDMLGRRMAEFEAITSLMGTLGFDNLAESMAKTGQAMSTIIDGAKQIAQGDYFKGAINMINGVIQAYKNMQDTGSEAGRIAQGAAVGGLIGGVPGAIVGGLIGAFMGDPDWKQLQDTVVKHWNVKISKELAKQIDADAQMIGGHVNAMLLHLTDIAATQGGITAANVGDWAERLGAVFPILERGELSAANAAKILDASFADLVKTGTTTSGIVADQIVQLVRLERQYKTGSAAIKEFVNAQLGMASGGFGKVVGGLFGVMMKRFQETKDENVTPEDKSIAETALKQLLGPNAQESFDRMGRLASVTFNAMIASGKGFFEALEAIGPALTTLTAAQQAFGFTSNEAFSQLMKFQQFATIHPELVASISGLNELMLGLNNTGFMTADVFKDIGTEAKSTFDRLIAGGLTSDEAMMAMHPTLQTLWELQRKFGYEVDEATQALIDEALASGRVGEQYMSANDRMVLGIDRLIDRFELFLKHLGITLPEEAEEAARRVEDAFNNISPQVRVRYRHDDPGGPNGPEPPEMAAGGVVTGPMLATIGEAGPEAVIPLDRLFDELDLSSRQQANRPIHVTVMLDRRVLTQAVLETMPDVLSLRGR